MTFILTGGERHDSMMAEALVEQGSVKRTGRGQPRRRPKRLVADKAYGKRSFRQFLRRRGIRVTIPRKANERRRGTFDKAIYRERNQVERFFNRLKQCRRVATRYEKRAVNYLAMITLAAILLWL
jgi:transposase